MKWKLPSNNEEMCKPVDNALGAKEQFIAERKDNQKHQQPETASSGAVTSKCKRTSCDRNTNVAPKTDQNSDSDHSSAGLTGPAGASDGAETPPKQSEAEHTTSKVREDSRPWITHTEVLPIRFQLEFYCP